MQNSTIVRPLAGLAAVIVVGVPLVGCADAPPEQAIHNTTKSSRQLQMEAEVLARKGEIYQDKITYEGDPWEERFRDRFWARQHAHDSWNRCHLAEDIPTYVQHRPGCP